MPPRAAYIYLLYWNVRVSCPFLPPRSASCSWRNGSPELLDTQIKVSYVSSPFLWSWRYTSVASPLVASLRTSLQVVPSPAP